jgi:phage terminase small subunit
MEVVSMAEDKLTVKQLRFVESYDGNATAAAIAAGYSAKTACFIGNENLRKPNIIKAIKAREAKKVKPHIASREDRQKFWTETMRDMTADLKNRLRASELLGKSEADFIERIEANINISPKAVLSEAEKRRKEVGEVDG